MLCFALFIVLITTLFKIPKGFASETLHCQVIHSYYACQMAGISKAKLIVYCKALEGVKINTLFTFSTHQP